MLAVLRAGRPPGELGSPLRRALAWRRSALRAGTRRTTHGRIRDRRRRPHPDRQAARWPWPSFTATRARAASPSRPRSSGPASPPTRSTTSTWARCSRPASARSAPARRPTNAGIPMTVPATTVNKVCLSGLNTIILADQLIAAGEADIVVAGGMESMTNAPYLLPGARAGFRLGDQTVVDSLMFDGLTCAFDHCAMGASTERDAAAAGLARPAMDELAARSHERAADRPEGWAVRRRDRGRVGAPASGRADRRGPRRGHPPRHDRREPRRPAGRVRRCRQRHRRQRLADLRRGLPRSW